MSFHKKFLIAMISLLVPFAAASAANAAGESVSAENTLTPRSGSFYKEKAVASNLKLDVVVTPGQGQALVDPLKNVKVTFPDGMAFAPNSQICPDSKLNGQSALGSPKAIVDGCANAVVGTGTATILLARQVAAPLSDPFLVAFNAGKDSAGQAKLKIYGYSKNTGVGILMNGTLKGRVLDIAVPVLSYDSAVANFNLQFPGPVLTPAGLGFSTQGKNPNYVQTKCAVSPMVTNAVFELGTRDPSSGQPTGPTTTKVAPATSKPCTGLAGKARFGGLRVSGPAGVKNGRRAVYRVVVRNTGTATARNVVVTSSTGGKGRGGNIAPGASRNVVVRTTIRGKKGRAVVVRFTAKSGAVKASAAKRVRVR